jgi:hypothetical protein
MAIVSKHILLYSSLHQEYYFVILTVIPMLLDAAIFRRIR